MTRPDAPSGAEAAANPSSSSSSTTPLPSFPRQSISPHPRSTTARPAVPPSPSTPRHDVALVIRFSQDSIPDVFLPVPLTAKIRHVKASLRPHLPDGLENRRVRLIHSGRLLDDAWSVGAALRLEKGSLQSRGASGLSLEADEITPSRSKGKERASNVPPAQRIYVHCSISAEPMSADALLNEAAEAEEEQDESEDDDEEERPRRKSFEARPAHDPSQGDSTAASAENGSRPSGFDRLLAGGGGFTPADVALLRTQFNSVIASRHTPDTMPSPTSLRRMEESWLDTASFAAPAVDSETGMHVAGDDEDSANALYDSFYGVMSGFFWPLGALFWGIREEGIWSRRRAFAVLAGIGINMGFGLVRVLS